MFRSFLSQIPNQNSISIITFSTALVKTKGAGAGNFPRGVTLLPHWSSPCHKTKPRRQPPPFFWAKAAAESVLFYFWAGAAAAAAAGAPEAPLRLFLSAWAKVSRSSSIMGSTSSMGALSLWTLASTSRRRK